MTIAESLACQTVVELVTAYLENDMDPDTRQRFEEHLALCPGCARYLDQIHTTVHALGTLPPEQLDPTFRARLLDAFRDWR